MKWSDLERHCSAFALDACASPGNGPSANSFCSSEDPGILKKAELSLLRGGGRGDKQSLEDKEEEKEDHNVFEKVLIFNSVGTALWFRPASVQRLPEWRVSIAAEDDVSESLRPLAGELVFSILTVGDGACSIHAACGQPHVPSGVLELAQPRSYLSQLLPLTYSDVEMRVSAHLLDHLMSW